jgi:cellulose synthase/poly-beta-1,6-N-acetylglucosamine synthase-like glycosyltransferase
MVVIAVVLSLANATLLILALWLLAEVIAARRSPAKAGPESDVPPYAVVVPAHNEGEGVRATLRSLKPQMRTRDRLIVVADNCTDNTAEVAASEGAEVLVRTDPERRGKGYALQYAVDHLREAPPEVVIFTDADCLHGPDFALRLAREVVFQDKPVQTRTRMLVGDTAPPSRRVAAFAWAFMTELRQSGLHSLAGTARLTGFGMGFPWTEAEKLKLGTGEIVEDLALSIDYVRDGRTIAFVSDITVDSYLPDRSDAARTQRARWEIGSLRMIRYGVPRLFSASFQHPRTALVALNVAVPPLVLFSSLLILALLVSSLAAASGIQAPLALVLVALLFFGTALAIGYVRVGHRILPLRYVPAVSGYLLEKFGVYGRSGRASAQSWTRTDRDVSRSGRADELQ